MPEFLTFSKPPKRIAETVCLIQAAQLELTVGAEITYVKKQDEVMLLGILSGSVLFSDYQQACIVSSGQGIYLHDMIKLCAETTCRYFSLILSGALAEQFMEDTYAHGGCLFPYSGQAITTLANGLFQVSEYFESTPHHESSLSSTAYNLLVQLYHQSAPLPKKRYSQLITDAIMIMQQEYAYLDSMDTLAERLFVSKPHFIRSFTAAVGISPGKYLTHVRIEHAKLLLQNGETSIDAIAGASGFSGASYFGKVFHKLTGMTPTQYIDTVPEENKIMPSANVYL